MLYKEQISKFCPMTKQEQDYKEKMLNYINLYPNILSRENEKVHITSSGFILNPTLDQALMVHHNIYQTYSFTGGHADSTEDLLFVAIKEAMEETGISYVIPIDHDPISLDILNVVEHIKNGKTIKEHLHLSVTFGLIAPENQTLFVCEKENSNVKWIPIDELNSYCNELHMIPIYNNLIQKMKKIVLEQQKNFSLCEMVVPLLNWYDQHARILPWRENKDPYRVWVSEIMLQQTRVDAVMPYFDRFLNQLPTLESLANAPIEQLLKLWEGLGYYNRVRNLQKTAQIIMDKFSGLFPRAFQELVQLPGIGEYTAGAISSISFENPIPAVDGNVLRVLARLMTDAQDVTQKEGKLKFTKLLKDIYPLNRCGDFTQSLMELGATVCLPNGFPKCEICPLSFMCKAFTLKTQLNYPTKSKKKPRKQEKKTVFILTCENKIAVRKREEKGLLNGLWEFPNVEGSLNENEVKTVLKDWNISFTKLNKGMNKKHIFTHVEWEMHSFLIHCENMPKQFMWVTKEILKNEITLPSAFKEFCKML